MRILILILLIYFPFKLLAQDELLFGLGFGKNKNPDGPSEPKNTMSLSIGYIEYFKNSDKWGTILNTEFSIMNKTAIE